MRYKKGDRFIIEIGPGQEGAGNLNYYPIIGTNIHLTEIEIDRLIQINPMASDEGKLLIIFENGREMLLDNVAGVDMFLRQVNITFTNGNTSHINDKVKYIGRPAAKPIE